MKIVKREDVFFEKHGFHISYDEDYMGEIEGLSDREALMFLKEAKKIDRKVKGTLARVKALAAKNEKRVAYKYLLALAYHSFGNEEKSRQVFEDILEQRPDYMGAITGLMKSYCAKEEFDKFADFVGKDMSITKFGNNPRYHVSDIILFYDQVFFYYFICKNDKEKAGEALEVLKDADINSDETQHCIEGYNMLCLSLEVQEEMIKETEERIGKSFNFPKETNELYTYQLSDGYAAIKDILALPREKVIEDLEMVLRDGLDNYEYWNTAYYNNEVEEEDLQFVLHTIFLLTELKSSKSLAIVWEILQDKRKVGDFYFDDHITETLWLDFYLLAKDDTPFLKKCLLQKNLVSFSVCPIYTTIGQTLHNEPQRRKEFLSLFEEVFDVLLERHKNGLEIDDILPTFLAIEGVNAGLVELEDRIILLEEANLIDASLADGNDLVEDLRNGNSDFQKLTVHPDIFARYEEQRKIMENFEKRHALLMKEEALPSPKTNFFSNSGPVTSSKKVGRNEPCPCGSGKKYKKCCINK